MTGSLEPWESVGLTFSITMEVERRKKAKMAGVVIVTLAMKRMSSPTFSLPSLTTFLKVGTHTQKRESTSKTTHNYNNVNMRDKDQWI